MHTLALRPECWKAPISRTLSQQTVNCGGLSQRETVSKLIQALKACITSKNLDKGRAIHSEAINLLLHTNIYVGTSLIDMYAKCRSMVEAHRVFDSMPTRNIVSWNTLMLGYVANEQYDVCLELFQRMDCEPTSRSFVAVFMACSSLACMEESVLVDGNLIKRASLAKGMSLHCLARSRGFCDDVYVGSTLIDMYGRCGSMVDSKRVFEKMKVRNVVSWNALILGYVENGESQKALQLFEEMVSTDCLPNSRTFVAAVMACTNLAGTEEATVKMNSLRRGMVIHSMAQKSGSCEGVVFVGNSLIDMYTKCGSMVDARLVFDGMTSHTVISWNCLLLGYVGNGESEIALELFSCMSFEPDERTYIAVLMACASLAESEEGVRDKNRKLVKMKSLSKGMELHSRAGFCGDIFLKTALVDMYAKCGSMADARAVFDTAYRPDVVLWTALIAGYAENGESRAALCFFADMKMANCVPNSKTYAAALMACGNLDTGTRSAVGRSLIGEVYGRGVDSKMSACCFIDFYTKCGSFMSAEHVFASYQPDTCAWNSVISGYEKQGDTSRVFELFREMQERGVRLNGITFVSVLAACSHAGLISTGQECFHMMLPVYGIVPSVEHYNCLVDMFARANYMQRAMEVIQTMPCKPNAVTWTSVLGACFKWKNALLGTKAFEQVIQLDKDEDAAYLLMANIYECLRYEYICHISKFLK